MRLVKAILFSLTAVGLFSLWSNRDYVVEAYKERPETEQVTLTGIDLAVTRSDHGPSPFVVPAAPDTRVSPLPVLARSTPDHDDYPVVSLTGGSVELSGVVLGPDGPVAGATVEVQRHTADGIAFRTLLADEAGEWELSGLLGGRYRVRAWLPGVLAMGSSEVVFLAEEDSKRFEFSLWGIDPSPRLELVAHEQVYLDVPAAVAVVLTKPVIDERGVIVTTPIPNTQTIVSVSQNMSVLSGPTQSTDAEGVARFVIVCNELPAEDVINTGVLVARADELVQTFPLPDCVPVPAPEPTDEGPGTDG